MGIRQVDDSWLQKWSAVNEGGERSSARCSYGDRPACRRS
nr:MAG TPA: hypothetical protein [Caudoviricetes sp.]